MLTAVFVYFFNYYYILKLGTDDEASGDAGNEDKSDVKDNTEESDDEEMPPLIAYPNT